MTEEEALVAELDLLGIHYLSRQTDFRSEGVRPAAQLLADLVRQPSACVMHLDLEEVPIRVRYSRFSN